MTLSPRMSAIFTYFLLFLIDNHADSHTCTSHELTTPTSVLPCDFAKAEEKEAKRRRKEIKRLKKEGKPIPAEWLADEPVQAVVDTVFDMPEVRSIYNTVTLFFSFFSSSSSSSYSPMSMLA